MRSRLLLALLLGALLACAELNTALQNSGLPAGGAVAPRNLTGEYAYLGRGACSVTQLGSAVRMLCTWAPAGRGPHYEIRGTLTGNTITGTWYSHYAKQGWFRYVATVRPDGSIEQSQSEDPIRSNIQTAVLTRSR